MKNVVHSMEEFYQRYLPGSAMRYREERKLGTIKVCPDCGCRNVVWNQHDPYGYFLCYGCGWSSLSAKEIGKAMAQEVGKKLKLVLSV